MAEETADDEKIKIKDDRLSLHLRYVTVHGISIRIDCKCVAEKQKILFEMCKTWKNTSEILAFSMSFTELIHEFKI
jgi:hypothetical protein